MSDGAAAGPATGPTGGPGTFEDHRDRLRAVATRLLGSPVDAEDALQEAWLRWHRSAGADPGSIDNLGGWLTTVVSRVALDMLRARRTRREDVLPDPGTTAGDAPSDRAPGPEDVALLADAVGPALLVVLDTLGPAERVAFVLHDLFAVPFEDVATVLDRSPAAVRQLASRARRRVSGGDPDAAPATGPDARRRRAVVTAFLDASRNGRFEDLLTLLAPDVVLRADPAAVRSGAPAELRGAPAVATTFSGRAQAARAALVDGQAQLVWSAGGRLQVVFAFTLDPEGRITEVQMIADPDEVSAVHVAPLPPAR